MNELQTYKGGGYLLGPWGFRDSGNRGNEVAYDPDTTLTPDAITDAAGRFIAFCIEGYPVLGRGPLRDVSILDLGTGSGNFLVSTLDGIKRQSTENKISITALDIDDNALSIAQDNIDHSIQAVPRPVEVEYVKGEFHDAFKNGVKYDFVYFNPPYLEHGQHMLRDIGTPPTQAVYVDDSAEYYRSIVPRIDQSLSENGFALVRLPREDAKIDVWLAEYMSEHDDTRLFSVIAGDEGRYGRFLGLCPGILPEAIGEYGYWENYLGERKRRMLARKSLELTVYHDAECEVTLRRIPRTILRPE
jgi:methylase of polypeptide subunit release factors